MWKRRRRKIGSYAGVPSPSASSFIATAFNVERSALGVALALIAKIPKLIVDRMEFAQKLFGRYWRGALMLLRGEERGPEKDVPVRRISKWHVSFVTVLAFLLRV